MLFPVPPIKLINSTVKVPGGPRTPGNWVLLTQKKVFFFLPYLITNLELKVKSRPSSICIET